MFIWVRSYIAIRGDPAADPQSSSYPPFVSSSVSPTQHVLRIQSNPPFPETRYSAEDSELEAIPQVPFQAPRIP